MVGGQLIGGTGDDTIVASGDKNEHIDLNGGGADIIVAYNGAKVTNYDASTNAGFMISNIDDIMEAIVDGEMTLSDNSITYNDNAKIEFGSSSDSYNVVNIYNSANEMTKVAWIHGEGDVLNMAYSVEDMLLVGNKNGNRDKAAATIISGLGDNTVIAGSGDNVQLSGGKDLVELTRNLETTQRQGATIDMSAGTTNGQATVTGFSDGFANDADKIKINSNDKFSFDFVGKALRLIFDKISLLFGLNSERGYATEEPDNIKNLLITNEYGQDERHTFIDNNGVLNINDRYEKSMVYHGLEGSAIDYSNFDEKLYVNLSEGGGESDRYINIDKVTGGRGATTLIGNDTANTLAAGKGNGSIYGAAGRDMLIGYSGDDKTGATTFYEVSGSGLDTVEGFEFGTTKTSDKIHTFGEGITNYELVGDDLRIQVGDNYDDQIMIEGAANEVLQINAWNKDYVVEVGDNFKYDEAVEFYLNKSGAATISADGAEDVAIYANGFDGKAYDNIKRIDASGATGKATLVGADGVDNVIIGGSGSNSLWGGSHVDDNTGNDLLVGGSGKNEFFYGLGNGRDTIEGAANGDIINLFDISLEDISGTEVTNSVMNIKFNDGGSLQLDSKIDVTFKVNDGTMSKEHLIMRN